MASLKSSSKPLLFGRPESTAFRQDLARWDEMFFVVSDSADLSFPEEYRSILRDYFSHSVAREPLDLRSHVRRIFVAYSEEGATDLFAALIDLFIVLGDRGASLRRRMLEYSKSRLGTHEYRRLKEAIDGTPDQVSSDFVPGSVLCRGVIGKMALSRFGVARSRGVRDPLIEAREFLEYSQVEEARKVLEQVLIREPQREDIQKELLDIYWSARDQKGFGKMLRELESIGNPLGDEWRELAERFRSLNG